MAIYFSATTCSFYDTNIISVSQMPEDKVAVSDSKYKELLDKQNAGYVIIAGPDGNPTVLQQTCGKCDCLALDDYVTKHKAETITGAKTFSVSPQAPTPDESSDDTTVATTAFVNAKTKTDSDNIVHKTGDETIGGKKTFTAPYLLVKNTAGTGGSGISVYDANDKGSSGLVHYYTNGKYYTRLISNNATADKHAYVQIFIDDNGNSTFSSVNVDAMHAPTPASTSNSTDIATTAWANAKFLPSPAGLVAPFAGKTAPSGWLKCDGSAVSRTTYAALFAAIGTLYGAGDGSTTFNLPNLIGRVPFGMADDYVGKSTEGVLPNITGKFMIGATNNTNDYTGGILGTEGAFSSDWSASNHSLGGGSGYSTNRRAIFDASRSSALYNGAAGWYGGAKVVPASVGMNYCIKY